MIGRGSCMQQRQQQERLTLHQQEHSILYDQNLSDVVATLIYEGRSSMDSEV